jgi:signal transduction histidine kinase/ligand-binding sensor domain-containing protein
MPDINQYAHTAWTVADGFTKGAIYDIAQTPDGYLWLGTEFGLLRFDGVRTTPFPSDRALPSSKIGSVLTGRDGTLWIGTSKGLVSWKDGKLTMYPALTGYIADRLFETRDGTVWVRALTPPTGMLCALRNGGMRCWGNDGGFGARITTLYEDRTGRVWFTEPHGLWQWNDGHPTFYPVPSDQFVQALNEDADGVLIVVVSGRIHRMVDGKLQEVYRLRGAIGELTTVVRVLRDRDGALWLGALGGGLAHLHDGTIDQFAQSDGLSSDSVGGLFQDREGNIWVATFAGLDRFRELPVTPLTLQQGFSSLRVLAVLASADGSIWLRTVDGVNHWKDGHVKVYRESADLSNGSPPPVPRTANDVDTGNNVSLAGGSLFEDERSRVWVSMARSVGYFDQGRFRALPGVPGGRVFAITGDFKGNVWFAHATRGLFHLANERVVDQMSWAELGHAEYADALVVDPSSGGLWLGFHRGGIALVKDGQTRVSYTSADGLGQGRVNDLRLGRDGALWAATEGGVSRLKNGRIATLSARDGLPCSETHWTMEDDIGDFWVSTPCGLVRISRAEMNAWVGQGKSVAVTVLRSSDGVRSRANVGAFSPHVAKATDGRLWFFPLEGLNVLDPRRLSHNAVAPPVRIEQVSADGQIYQAASAVWLPPLIRDLGIEYTAISLVSSEKVLFRTKLEGHDREWQDAGNRRQAFYTNLRPGPYRFHVMASDNGGVWNGAGASLDFSIAPAYYQTRWFLAFSIVAVIGLVWSAHRVRVRIVEKHQHEISALNERLMKAQEQERIRIAGELHDGVMQQMLAATMMVGTAKRRLDDPRQARATLDKIQDKLVQAGTDIRQLSHDLHPPLLQDAGLPTALRAYCQQFSGASGIPVSCDCDESAGDLSRGAALALFRIVQEALGNAAKHAHGTRIGVLLSRSGDVVSLSVADDGVGFAAGRPDTPGGLGLVMMRERASQLNGTFEFESAPGRGTTIKVVIPFR